MRVFSCFMSEKGPVKSPFPYLKLVGHRCHDIAAALEHGEK